MILRTDRLTMAPPTVADAPEIFARYASDPDVTRYMAWPRHRTVDDALAFVAFSDAEWRRHPAGPLLIRSRTDDQLLGSTGMSITLPGHAMVGYILARDAWGQGYATEALRAMVELGLTLGLERLFAPFHPDNHASRRVLERCGFSADPTSGGTCRFPNLDAEADLPCDCFEKWLTWTPTSSAR